MTFLDGMIIWLCVIDMAFNILLLTRRTNIVWHVKSKSKLHKHVLTMDEISAIATEAQGHADHTTRIELEIGEYGIGHTVSMICPVCTQGKNITDSSEW